MNSCAAWLSWKCQMSSGTAREHVRVARALRDLPVIRAGFAAARLSYAKVRALTRIATPATEAGLAVMAEPMTGNQLERFARAHRHRSRADDAAARVRRRLTWRFEEDGSLAGRSGCRRWMARCCSRRCAPRPLTWMHRAGGTFPRKRRPPAAGGRHLVGPGGCAPGGGGVVPGREGGRGR